jgi:hypothetical protein
LAQAEGWFSEHRARWQRRFDRLGMLLDALDEPEEKPKPRKKKS